MLNLSELSLYVQYQHRKGLQFLPESIISAAIQMLNGFVVAGGLRTEEMD